MRTCIPTQGFIQDFLLGGGGREKYCVPNFCFTSWKIAPGVHGVLDKIK